MKRDKYDDAIDYLMDNAEQIREAWLVPSYNLGGCLFQFAKRDDRSQHPLCNNKIGCLTTIRKTATRSDVNERHVAITDELTAAIRNDDRIPDSINIIMFMLSEERLKTLKVFAEWQRRLDRELLPQE